MIVFNEQEKTLIYKDKELTDCIKASDMSPLFRLYVELRGSETKNIVLTSKDMKFVGLRRNDNELNLSYELTLNEEDMRISAKIFLNDTGPEMIGKIEAEISGDAMLKRVQFPCVEISRIYPFDSLLISAPWGDNIKKPLRTIAQYCAGQGSSWIYDYVHCDEDEVVYSYPSIMSMQYMTLYNDNRAFYLGSYSTGAETMTFNAKALETKSLQLSINHFPFSFQEKWKSPECSIAFLKGDWHASADLYASHMRKEFTSPDSPEWMRADDTGWDGFVQLFMRMEGEEPKLRYEDLPRVFARVKRAGMNTMHVAGWNYNGFDTCYPDYNTDPKLGTEEELKTAIKQINSMGGRVILYTNGRLVDPDSDYYKNGGDRYVCLDEEGNPYIESYNTSANFNIACPECTEYRQYLAAQAGKIARDYGADAIQIDQIGCNYAYFCYDRSHPHPTPATNFLTGVSGTLMEVRKAHKKENPDFFTWCEGCNERFGQYHDVSQGIGEGHSWQLGESIPEQFLYTFPDRCVTGVSNDIQQLCHTFSQGKPFDLALRCLDDSEYCKLLKKLIDIRKGYPKYYYQGVFNDNVGLRTNSGIRAFAIKSREDESFVVNLWNPGAEPWMQSFTYLEPMYDYKTCKQIFPQVSHLTSRNNILKIEWTGPVAVLLFE